MIMIRKTRTLMMWTMAKKTTKRWEEYDYDKIMMDNDKEDNNTNDYTG